MNKNNTQTSEEQREPSETKTASEKKSERRRQAKWRKNESAWFGDDAELLNRLSHASQNLGEQIEVQLHERPYVVLGAAAGIGFAAGSLLGSRLGQIAIAFAGGYIAHNLVGSGSIQRIVRERIDKASAED